MQVKFFSIQKQNQLIKSAFLQEVEKILDNGNICMGKLCQEFEEKWARMNGSLYCCLVKSGTDALSLSLDALDVNGLVLVPAVSFIATPNAVSLNRSKVLFCETNDNGNIDILHVISKVHNQRLFNPVKALLCVAMYGNPPDLENLQKLSKNNNIPLILDSAQAHLATFNNKPLIDYCDVVTQSFYVTKNMGCLASELGCILTNNEEVYNRIKSLRNHGRGKDNYDFEEVGYNSRPSEMAAASLLVKLPFVEEWTERRINIAKKYNELLTPLKNSGKLRFLEIPENVRCVYHLYPTWVNGDRDKIRKELLENGVETNCQYPIPLHLTKSYKGQTNEKFEIAEELCSKVITLPMFDQLLDEEVEYVARVLNKIL